MFIFLLGDKWSEYYQFLFCQWLKWDTGASQVMPAWRKHLPTQEMQERQVQSLGREEPPEEGMATHSSILTWKVPWTDEPGGLQSVGLQSQTWLSMHIASKVIIDTVGLISTIFVTVFSLLPLFFVLIFIFQSYSAFGGFNWMFYVLDWQKRNW